jgi:two-component system, LytTR family, response regulator
MINALLIENQKVIAHQLEVTLAKYFPQISLLEVAGNVQTARKCLRANNIQLVLLDLEMSLSDDLDQYFLDSKRNFETVFITSYEKNVCKLMRLSSCQYIIKPMKIKDIVGVMNKTRERIDFKMKNNHLDSSLEESKKFEKGDKVALPTMEGLVFEKIENVIRCEADESYTWFHFTHREKLLVTKNLGKFEERFSALNFVRVHHAHLINQDHIVEWKKAKNPVVVMSDNSLVTVSKRKSGNLRDRFL